MDSELEGVQNASGSDLHEQRWRSGVDSELGRAVDRGGRDRSRRIGAASRITPRVVSLGGSRGRKAQ